MSFTAPYTHLSGCLDRMPCKDGKSCLSAIECADCTFGKCIQLAKEKHSEGFSYSSRKECKLCTSDQLESIQTEENWAIYRATGDSEFNYLILGTS